MAKITEDGKKTEYESYEEYVSIQDSRFHDYDCPNCLVINQKNVELVFQVNSNIKNILDVGCRDSAYFDELIAKGISCKGIDISPRSVEYAKSKNRDVIECDVNNLSKAFSLEEFDFIISSHSFEHFSDHAKALQECSKVLKNNGHLLLRFPNESKISDVKTKAHTRAFTKDELMKLIDGSNFEVIVDRDDFINEFFIICKNKKKKECDLQSLPLYNVDENWTKKFNKIMEDSYVKNKYNRERRLTDKLHYVNILAPEVKETKGFVIDIGPGPGEFLEICRYYGNEVLGIDAKINNDQMGLEYVTLSSLMFERQKMECHYQGFDVQKGFSFDDSLGIKDEVISFINSQGSIEQVFKEHLVGPVLLEHKNCSKLSWNISDVLKSTFMKLFDEVYRVLVKDGIFLIYANGTKNTLEYFNFVSDIINNDSRFELMSIHKDYESIKQKRIHKMKKK